MNFQCPSCGKPAPDSSMACPHCGHSFVVELEGPFGAPSQRQPVAQAASIGQGAPQQQHAPSAGGFGGQPNYAPPQYASGPGYGAPGFGAPPGGFAPSNMRGVECKDAQTALIVSIVGFFCCGVILGPIAIFLGLKAKETIRLNPGMQGGQKATAAIAIGALEFVLFLIVGLFRVVAGFSRARRF